MPEESLGVSDPDEPLPFEHLFVPLVVDARAELRQKITPDCYALLRPAAHTNWERYLLKRLCRAGAKAAHCQFQGFKTVRSVFTLAATERYHTSDRLYRAFIGPSPTERLQKLFDEFPTLAEYCEVLTANWTATVDQFLQRLKADHGDLNAHFDGVSFTGLVVSVQAGLSDPHHGGSCVVRLTFESGSSLIYKPRSIAPEAHFSELLKQLNTEAITHLLRTTQCWDRSEYGWMEDVICHPCATLAKVQAFYWRAGALLALVYLARGVDMHRENLIAAGEFPVLVDLEALWHLQGPTDLEDSPIAATVLRTGLLPQNHPKIRTIYGWNAFSNRTGSNILTTLWSSINKDDMISERVDQPFHDAFHLPTFAGTEHLARDFTPDILNGFRWIGKQVIGNEQKRKRFRRWIKALMQCRRRQILRPSLWYQSVLEQMTSPLSLRKKDAVFEDYVHASLNAPPLTEMECRALRQLEIPWLEQKLDQEGSRHSPKLLPTKREFAVQEAVIIEALAPCQN